MGWAKAHKETALFYPPDKSGGNSRPKCNFNEKGIDSKIYIK